MRSEHSTGDIAKCLRLMLYDKPGHLARVATEIGNQNVRIGDIRLIRSGRTHSTRELVIFVSCEDQLEDVIDALTLLEGVIVEDVFDLVQAIHKGGKIATKSRVDINTISDVRKIYTPGVAAICKDIEQRPELAYQYTAIPNQVAIVTNGTAILGLGDIGAVAGMPVMEGKAALFDRLVGVSGVPILIQNHDPQVIIDTVRNIAPTFGAIKLEDIKAPECFEIEDTLDGELDIPVLHDDQHGTAVVVLASLLNATRFSGLMLRKSVVGVIGLGAAGMGISKLLTSYGVSGLIGTDLDADACKRFESIGGRACSLTDVMRDSHIVIATTGCPQLIKPEMVRKGSVILALSNPNPEIEPELAVESGAAFAADGKSVNNALAFPGLFRGALNIRATRINDKMKIAAAQTIAKCAEENELVPGLLHPEVHQAVTAAVERAGLESGAIKPW
ncbi:malate dehydrogenase (oxaloacetate-decarboxylating) [Malonomonas rubra DSM 5091]|uniref:Malate dehydrogenase (Oxaloacetate-decarboxylating) n=2 Tax=Malonomonas rubra TaxID=57040 RepID=A0A1M6FCL9_MALRU|nr:malic enzyme-like NAD(P)-binding protein [Malonomonas rubra]SHI95393.1 malate dehydrogenase (oxaloacetate-decarboxylating) [Malonomonas rubra DSM 5091]